MESASCFTVSSSLPQPWVQVFGTIKSFFKGRGGISSISAYITFLHLRKKQVNLLPRPPFPIDHFEMHHKKSLKIVFFFPNAKVEAYALGALNILKIFFEGTQEVLEKDSYVRERSPL